jgi:hypothetical protein
LRKVRCICSGHIVGSGRNEGAATEEYEGTDEGLKEDCILVLLEIYSVLGDE